MATGTFRTPTCTAAGSGYSRYIYVKWSSTNDSKNNQSTINWTAYGGSDDASTVSYVNTGPVIIKINKTTVLNITDRIQLKKDSSIGKGSITVTHDSNGMKDVSVSISANIYIGSSSDPNNTYSGTITMSPNPVYTLSISAGTGSNITVNRTSSGGAGATGNLSAGSNKLYYGDKLKITFTADTNYGISTHTVNGNSFASGNTHTVSKDVAVVATSEPLISAIGATNADIESVSVITVTRYNDSHTYTIRYSFGNLSGYINTDGSISSSAIKLDARIIPFTIPDSFYTQIPNAKSGTCTLTCTTYNGNTSLGSTTCTMKLTASEDECSPTVSGTVIDTNETTLALTGNSNTLIRYKSTAKCTITAIAKNSADITSRLINNEKIKEDDGKYSVEFEKVDVTSFEFKATDSRGYSKTETVESAMVPYIQLTCNPIVKRATPTGTSILLSAKGNIYNGVFGDAEGAATNQLTLQYRYKVAGETYGSWQTVNSTDIVYGTSSYTIDNVSLGDEFDYRTNYVFQIKATDGATVNDVAYTLSQTQQDISVPRGLPVFDWGEDDFNFNVPLTLTVDKEGQDTRVYNLTGLSIAFSSCYDFAVAAEAGSGYEVQHALAKLIGSTLRIYIGVHRTSAPSVGDIVNEKVATLVINHGGKIKAAYNTGGVSSDTGGVATFSTYNLSKVDENNISVSVRMCATTTNSQTYGCYLLMPVLPNLDAFTKEVVADEEDITN